MVQSNDISSASLAVRRSKPIRKAILVLAAASLVSLLLFAWTFAPLRLQLPDRDVGPLPPASPPAAMLISALPTGTYETPAAMAYRGGSWTETRQFAATAILVRHPKGNVRIDMGFGRNVDRHLKLLPSVQQAAHHIGQPVVDRLGTAPAPRDTISAIIPTHAHWDHISGAEDLRGVPVMENAAGRSFIHAHGKGDGGTQQLPERSLSSLSIRGRPLSGLPEEPRPLRDGAIVLVPAPGHTPDSIVVFVNLPSGKRYAFIGDLIWQIEGLTRPAEKPWMLRMLIGEDRAEVRQDIARIRAAIRRYPEISAVPAHDGRAFRAIAIYPARSR